jgi:hypothetical protein
LEVSRRSNKPLPAQLIPSLVHFCRKRLGDDIDREDSRLTLRYVHCGFAQRPLKACLPRREIGLCDDERHGPQIVCTARSSDAPGTPGALSLVRETATGSSSEVRDRFGTPQPYTPAQGRLSISKVFAASSHAFRRASGESKNQRYIPAFVKATVQKLEFTVKFIQIGVR